MPLSKEDQNQIDRMISSGTSALAAQVDGLKTVVSQAATKSDIDDLEQRMAQLISKAMTAAQATPPQPAATTNGLGMNPKQFAELIAMVAVATGNNIVQEEEPEYTDAQRTHALELCRNRFPGYRDHRLVGNRVTADFYVATGRQKCFWKVHRLLRDEANGIDTIEMPTLGFRVA